MANLLGGAAGIFYLNTLRYKSKFKVFLYHSPDFCFPKNRQQ